MIRPKTKLELEIEAQRKRGILLVVSGPSAGVGKDAVINGLKEKYKFAKIVTYTTRKRRDHEVENIDYHFVTVDEFKKRMKDKFFLEWMNYLDNYYGTPKQEVMEKLKTGGDVLMRVDVRGAKAIKQVIPSAVTVYIAPPSFEVLEKRMEKRRDDGESISKKLQVAVWEIEQFEGFDYVVVNEEGLLEKTIEYVKMIVEVERRRVAKSY